jgi:two-component system, NarL family, nitrate/nitrite response regulator NarL
MEVIDAGCAGCIVHDASPIEYSTAILQVMKGKAFYCRQTEKVLHAHKKNKGNGADLPEVLSKKYKVVLSCLWRGFNSKEAAVATGLTKKTIDTYRKNLRKIIGSLSAAALENFMRENGIK